MMTIKMYKAVNTGQLAKLIEQDDKGVLFELEDGTQKRYAMSTFKRWWRLVETEEVEDKVETKPEPEVIVEKPQPKPQPKPEPVVKQEQPKAEKIKEVMSPGLLGYLEEEVTKRGLAIVESGYGYTVKENDQKFSRVMFKFYPRKKFIKIRVKAEYIKEIGAPYHEIKGDAKHVYIHLSHDSGVNRDIVKKIIAKSL